jgi:hypothetical protein
VTWPGAEIKLASGPAPPPAAPGTAPNDMWVAAAPKALFENAAFGDSLELVETPARAADGVPPRRVTVSSVGLASSIGALVPRCR